MATESPTAGTALGTQSGAARVAVLRGLLQADGFEQFLHARYTGQKRFSLEGGETMVAAVAANIAWNRKSVQ